MTILWGIVELAGLLALSQVINETLATWRKAPLQGYVGAKLAWTRAWAVLVGAAFAGWLCAILWLTWAARLAPR